ncbi:hypothetical protein F0U61_06075 [Archangium violaceum]|uniref:hypothetical protein n=1 Tax=Archangium violaceum TaxID=83451 RepID=UPI002B2BE2E5|nr:hypothetical protein F0U61_06075 [Archangium violaceum]
MSRSPGSRHEVRQQCPGLSFGARTLAVLALLFSGCTPDSWECVDSSDCTAGLTCVHWKGGSEPEERFCAKSCAVEQSTCDTGESCSCPDSPLKERCFDEDGNRIGVCGR